MLFRDEILKLKERFEDSDTHCRRLLKEIDQCLFVNKDRQQLRLLPSFYDRKPFKKILFSDQEDVVEDEEVSYQNLARKFFSIKIQEEATKKKVIFTCIYINMSDQTHNVPKNFLRQK